MKGSPESAATLFAVSCEESFVEESRDLLCDCSQSFPPQLLCRTQAGAICQNRYDPSYPRMPFPPVRPLAHPRSGSAGQRPFFASVEQHRAGFREALARGSTPVAIVRPARGCSLALLRSYLSQVRKQFTNKAWDEELEKDIEQWTRGAFLLLVATHNFEKWLQWFLSEKLDKWLSMEFNVHWNMSFSASDASVLRGCSSRPGV